MNSDRLERHYKTSELAESFNVDEETIRRAARRGDLRSVRIGRGTERRFPESAVREYQELLASKHDPRLRS